MSETATPTAPVYATNARFIYVDDLVGQHAYVDDRWVMIERLQVEADGDLYGSVDCVNVKDGKVLGRRCISTLKPSIDHQDVAVVVANELDTLEDKFQRAAEARRLEAKVDELVAPLNKLCTHFNVPLKSRYPH